MKAKLSRRSGEVTLALGRRDEPLMDAATRAALKSSLALKNILVPIDFSDCSKKALCYALPLAKEHQAAITLLYVAPPAYGAAEYTGVDYAQLIETIRVGGEKELNKWAADEVFAGISTETVVRVGSPAPEIVKVARELPADLVVISTHGRTGLKHVFLGSVVEQVVQRAPCPVFVVRERERDILT